MLVLTGAVFAGSATWSSNATNGDWNNPANWTPPTVPNDPNDTATFGFSNTTALFTFGDAEVDSIVFNADASAFTITAQHDFTLTISGTGIAVNSVVAQTFVATGDLYGSHGTINFTNSATAGTGIFITRGSVSPFLGAEGGLTTFNDNSTAGDGTFITDGTNNGGSGSGVTEFNGDSTAGNATFTTNDSEPPNNPLTTFNDNSTAGNGIFTNNGATQRRRVAGLTTFNGGSTAGNGTFTNNGATVNHADSGKTIFNDTSDAGNATLIANLGSNGGGGSILFFSDSTGGMARTELFGNGSLDISGHNTPGMTIGSIEGTGDVLLGANNLTVGSNNLGTTFFGEIDGSGGSLTKIGSGTLVLSGANTYTGGTTINSGKLIVSNKRGSGTGSGPVQVNKGTLRGRGTIGGGVTLGTGSGHGAVLSPGEGRSRPDILNIQSTLTFNFDATYNFELNSRTGNVGKVVANGVTITGGATFSFAEFGNTVLSPGTVIIAINNTAGTPISGTFSNLADGSTITGTANNFQVSYEGGDGNDLTLTVVP
jgi:autotransporter-associated beta strand protein